MALKIWSIIPARSGSKGVPGKNTKLLAGYPLIAWSIRASLACPSITRTIVNTNSDLVAQIAEAYGAEVPFMRPEQISGDNSTDLEWFQHAMEWFKKGELEEPDFVVHLRPTTPLRDPKLLQQAVSYFMILSYGTSMRSVQPLDESPYKMFRKEGHYLKPYFLAETGMDITNLPRQVFPTAYHPNGYIDILNPRVVLPTKSLHGCSIIPFETPKTIEIDTEANFEEAEAKAKDCPLFPILERLF